MTLLRPRSLPPARPVRARASTPIGARVCAVLAIAFALPLDVASGQAVRPVSNTIAVGTTARPGDVVRISVWREPDLSGDFPVDETGTVTLPRLGAIVVTSETPASLRNKLIAEYETFLNHRSVTVTLLRRVQVLGAVRSPGLFTADGTMTVGDVLAQAGGVLPEGDAGKLRLIRRGGAVAAPLSSQMLVADSPVMSGDQIYVPEKRWIARYPGIAAAGITAAASLVVALTRR